MKTIVNIVSKETIPNFLFVKEICKNEIIDNIIWIVTSKKESQDAMSNLEESLPEEKHIKINFEPNGEESITYMEKVLKENICLDSVYFVNLTGGTKLMSLTVYNFFKENCQNAEYYYKPIEKNTIINITNGQSTNIGYKVSVKEYLGLYGLRYTGKGDVYLGKEEAEYMYSKYKEIQQSNEIKKLRGNEEELRELKELAKLDKDKRDKEIGRLKRYRDNLKETPISTLEDKDIQAFLQIHSIPTKKYGTLSSKDVKYMTGEWFEDFIYYLTETKCKPDNILHGIHIKKKEDKQSDNEIDVIYTKENKLYVIECKTGIPKKEFNNIADKATSIKTLLGKNVESSFYTYLDDLGTDTSMINMRKEKLDKHDIKYKCKPDIDKFYNEIDKLEQSSL